MKENKKYHNPPKLAEWIIKNTYLEMSFSTRLGDFGEIYNTIYHERGIIPARLWYWSQIFICILLRVINSAIWSVTMFKNYLKIALRNIFKYRLFSFINVFGLATGIATCMIICLWVQRELSYDDFHTKSDRIYRIERELFRDKAYSRWPITSGAYKQALIDDYPEIENATRIWRRLFTLKDHKEVIHRELLYAVDNSIFDIFDFGLEEGDKATALTEPRTVVLTRENAFKFFGTDDVIGRSLPFEWNEEFVDFRVTGILKEIPVHSHIHFDMLMSISSYPNERFGGWRGNYLYTYVLTGKNVIKKELDEKFKSFVSLRLEPVYGDLLNQGLGIHEVLKMELFPIADIHLYPSVNWEIEPGGNIASVYIFSSIALLILFIACANFMILSTSRANKRAKEVSLRKTIGANSGQLRIQFIQESVLLAVFALFIAVFLILMFIPVFNNVFNETMSADMFLQPQNMLFFVGITLAVGLLSGLYPAFYLTRFEPADVLKGGLRSGKGKSAFRRNMVAVQFIISITLIIGMITIYKQMDYIQTKSLGFDKENVVVLPLRSNQVSQNFETFRNSLLNGTRVLSVSTASDVPIDGAFSNGGFYTRENPDENIDLTIMTSDFGFVETYKIEMIAGRAFSRDFITDTSRVMVLNEAAAKRIGWTPEEAVGKDLAMGNQNNLFKVVGVMKNFNFRSLRSEIEPLTILLYPINSTDISVRIASGDVDGSLNFIKQTWEEVFPGEQFDYSFLDQSINLLYMNENKMQNIFLLFSCFSIFVACLGLFGLATFSSEERTKEIGIRKVMGASIGHLIYLLTKEFTKWVIIANIIAWPLAWYFMDKWLQSFAYRTTLTWYIFAFAGIIAFVIALLTVSLQTIKSARANPVDSIRYE